MLFMFNIASSFFKEGVVVYHVLTEEGVVYRFILFLCYIIWWNVFL